jgi:uncharacterized protein YndB with AHSA1/START domain
MDIKHNLFIKASADNVYKAVSTTKGIKGWWSKDCEVGEQEGEKSILHFDKQGKTVTMGFQTETLVPNKKVVWACTENGNPAWNGTKIITEISETGGGSDVVFSHAGFDDKWAGQDPYEMTKQGWDHFVKSLVSYCESSVGQPW